MLGMEKVNRSLIDPLGGAQLNKAKAGAIHWLQQTQIKMEKLFLNKGILIAIIGFLLGRALILSHLSPFSLPFFAAVFLMKKEYAPLVLVGLLSGAFTIHYSNSIVTFAAVFVFLMLHKIRKPEIEGQFKTIAMYVFTSLFLVDLAQQYLLFRSIQLYDLMMFGVEAGLAMILTFIFIQSIPLLSIKKRSQSLKTEEVVSIIILLASVMTGTIGWVIYDLSLDHIFSRYLVLLFGLAGGAAIGSTVGVVTGLIFSLASVSSLFQMSLLAFSGLLGGLLKEGKKVGVAVGLLIATVLMGLYDQGTVNIMVTLYESLCAIALFLITPTSIIQQIAKHIPGTTEHADEQQQYARKIRDLTAQRVEQFSHVFKALSNSFTQIDEYKQKEDKEKELDYFLSNVTEKTCQTCYKKEKCWGKNFYITYESMEEIMYQISENNGKLPQKTANEWGRYCRNGPKVIQAISHELTFYEANKKLKKQIKESRKLVADQLLGVSAVMDDFAKEITREQQSHHQHEESIMEAIQDFGLQIGRIEIYNLDQGNVDIEMSVPYCQGRGECEKLIAPMLSDILGETIVVHSEKCATNSTGECEVIFRSAKKYVVETGVAHAAKGGGLVSGDSYTMLEIGSGKYAVAISDGMGNGERAQFESRETLKLLQEFLQSGIEEKIAIKAVNSVLSLRTTDEIFSTLDLAMIDLQDAKAKFLKICSIPSFIKRGSKIIKIESSNLPMGIIDADYDVDVVSEQLKAGDILIMMSDGIFDGPNHIENIDFWMKRKIKELQTDDPQAISDLILEEVIRSKGVIDDDMTVVTAKIMHNTPKWASIPVTPKRKKAQ